MLQTLSIRNYRTFEEQQTLQFRAPFTAIVGPNGSGKTSSISALQLLYGVGDCARDTEVQAVFGAQRFAVRGDTYFVGEQAVSAAEFRQRLPSVVFPGQAVLELARPERAQAENAALDTLRQEFKQASDALAAQKRLFTHLKQQADAAQNYTQAQKDAITVKQERYCHLIAEQLRLIEQCERERVEEEAKLAQIPISQELQRGQAILNDLDTSILRLTFQEEQNQNESSSLQPRIGKLQAQIQQLENKISIVQSSIRQFAAKQHESSVAAVQVAAKLHDLKKQAAKLENQQQIRLPDNFAQLRARFQEQHGKELTLRKTLKDRLFAAQQSILQTEAKIQKEKDEKEQTDLKIQQVRKEMQDLDLQKQAIMQQITSNSHIISEAKQQKEDCDRKITNLQTKLDECSVKITKLTQNSKMMQQQQKYARIKQEFKSSFGARFHGALKDLLIASNPEYQQALQFATAGLQNAFVVDDFMTAQAAVQQLKQAREPPQTFIVLDQLQDPQRVIDNALVNAVKRVPQYDKLFAFACRNTVLVDSSSGARNLAKSVNSRVVTKDCKLFSPTGTLQAQIGVSNAGSSELDFSRLGELQSEKAQLDSKFSEYKAKRQACELQIAQLEQKDVLELEFSVRQTQQKIDFQQLDLIRLQQKSEQASAMILSCKERAAELSGEAEEMQAALDQQTRLVSDLKIAFYQPVIQQLGLSGEQFLQFEASIGNNSALELQKQIISEEERLRVLEQNQYQADIDRFSAQGQNLTSQAQKARKELSVLTMRLQELENERHEQLAQISRLQLEAERQKQAMQLELQQRSHHADELQRIQQRIAAVRQEAQARRAELTALLEGSFTEQVRIPAESEAPRQALEAFVAARGDPVRFLRDTYKIDLSFLPNDSIPAAQRVAELDARLVKLQAELSKTVDLSVLGKIEVERTKLQSLLDAHLAKKQAYTTAMRDLNRAEESDLHKYQAFLAEIELRANEIYKQFTAGLGKISLSSDAFNECQIIAIPPGDGARRVEDLSGGEQALVRCSIALAFCIEQHCKIAIFDEIDANLDGDRVIETARCLREVSDRNELQIIVISHKPDFCAYCGALCGIAKREDEGARAWWIWA